MSDFDINNRSTALSSVSRPVAPFGLIRLAPHRLSVLGLRSRIDGARHVGHGSLRLNLRQSMSYSLLRRQNSRCGLKIWRHDFHNKTPLSLHGGNEYPQIMHERGEQSLKHFMIIFALCKFNTLGEDSAPMNIGDR